VGDPIAVFDPKLNYLGQATAGAISLQGTASVGSPSCPTTQNVWQLTLGALFPLSPGYVVSDMARAGSAYYVHDNTVRFGLAEAYRAQSSNGYVQGNRISQMVMGGLNLMSDAGLFYEGSGASNVTVAGNTITAVNQSAGLRTSNVAWNMGAISVSVAIPTAAPGATSQTNVGLSSFPLHQQDLIYGNTLSNLPYQAISVVSSSSTRVIKNTVTQSNQLSGNTTSPYQGFLGFVNRNFCFPLPPAGYCSTSPVSGSGSSSLFWAFSSNGSASGNTRDVGTTLGIYADPVTTTNVQLQSGY
jgi:hypothetical protein